MKLPNGYGSVYKLCGNRRKPYVATKTIGFKENGQQILKPIGYYETREEGLQALALYNNAPYNIDLKNITFMELYSKWLEKKNIKIEKEEMSDNSLKLYINAYKNHCETLHNKTFINIKTSDIQVLIDNCEQSFTIKKYIKGLCNQLFEFASQLDIPISKNYAKFVELGKEEISTLHKNIKESDINLLWENLHIEDVDLALILIYTGLRPSELLKIKKENVFLENRYMIGGNKTNSGKNRIIPIHEKIVPLIRKRLDNNTNYLIASTRDMNFTYVSFKERWDKMISKLELNYLPHDCRHTCATRLDNVKANKICIKLILGHKIQDITDGVYTHKNINQLVETINLLK